MATSFQPSWLSPCVSFLAKVTQPRSLRTRPEEGWHTAPTTDASVRPSSLAIVAGRRAFPSLSNWQTLSVVVPEKERATAAGLRLSGMLSLLIGRRCPPVLYPTDLGLSTTVVQIWKTVGRVDLLSRLAGLPPPHLGGLLRYGSPLLRG